MHRRKAALATLDLVATRRQLVLTVKSVALRLMRLHAASVETIQDLKYTLEESQRGEVCTHG